jgi:hypothetical protein
VRSVPESSAAPTEFCAEERIGFGGATFEGRFAFQSTAIQASDGRMIDTNVRTIGSVHLCADWRHPDAVTYEWYGEGTLGGTPFQGIGECRRGKADFPERGLRVVNCRLDISGLPSDYVGGVLTSNTMQSRKRQGMETDPPGYTQASIATIRLWRKRDAPSSAIPPTKESLVGTWKLVSYARTENNGQVRYAFGLHPTGFITYTTDGRMPVIMDGRKMPPSAEEAAGSSRFHSLLNFPHASLLTLNHDWGT